MDGKVTTMDGKVTTMDGKVTEVDRKVGQTARGLSAVMDDVFAPWNYIRSSDGSNKSEVGDAAVSRTNSLVNYYGIATDACMLLGRCSAPARIICAHLWPNHTKGQGLNFLGLEVEDVHCSRNFLRLHKDLERAFDRYEIALLPVWSPLPAPAALPGQPASTPFRLKVTVMKKELLNSAERVTISSSRALSWQEIDGLESNCEFGSLRSPGRPYTRVLAQHMHSAIKAAEQYGWIEEPADIGELRERALLVLRHSLPTAGGFGIDK